MNSSCARTDALMRRLLGDDEVAAPTDEERQHAASCPACRSVIEHSARLDGIFTSHFAAVRATAPKIRFVFPPQASADAATAAGWRAWCEQLLTGWFGPERLRLAAAVGAVVIVAVLAGGLSLLRGHFGSDERGVGASGASAAGEEVAASGPEPSKH